MKYNTKIYINSVHLLSGPALKKVTLQYSKVTSLVLDSTSTSGIISCQWLLSQSSNFSYFNKRHELSVHVTITCGHKYRR